MQRLLNQVPINNIISQIGEAYYLNIFTGDSVGLALTALADTPPSDNTTFRLHGALLALLLAYLPPSSRVLFRHTVQRCDGQKELSCAEQRARAWHLQ